MAVTPHAQSLRDLSARVDVAGAYSPTAERRASFAARFPFPVTDDLDALAADPSIEAAMILTPPRTHLPLVERFAAAGKHVLLEKPLEADTARAEAVVAACERGGRHARRRAAASLPARRARARGTTARRRTGRRRGGVGARSVVAPADVLRRARARHAGARRRRRADHAGDPHARPLPVTDAARRRGRRVCRRRRRCTGWKPRTSPARRCALPTARSVRSSATTASFPGFAERIEIVGTKGTAVLTAGKVDFWWHDGRRESLGEEATLGGGADPMAFANDAHRAVLDGIPRRTRREPSTRQQRPRRAARPRRDRRRAAVVARPRSPFRSPTLKLFP